MQPILSVTVWQKPCTSNVLADMLTKLWADRNLLTGAETVPGFEMAPWVGIIAPARTPKEIVERLSQETLAIMHDPQVVKQLTEQQVTPFALGPDRLGDLIRKDIDKWAGVIKNAGIKGE